MEEPVKILILTGFPIAAVRSSIILDHGTSIPFTNMLWGDVELCTLNFIVLACSGDMIMKDNKNRAANKLILFLISSPFNSSWLTVKM
jgi:hypothetical protein